MKHFYKIPSAVQIVFAEMLTVWSLSSFIMSAWNTIRPGAFGDMSLRGVGSWVWFLIGFALLAWMMREIFRPRVKGETWRAAGVGSLARTNYSFLSTHPSYLLLDLVIVSVFLFLRWYASAPGYPAGQFSVMLAVSLVVPLVRFTAWYILGLRVEDEAAAREAWKPAVMLFVPFLVVFAVIGVMVWFAAKQAERELASLPVIDEQSFADSRAAFSRLVDGSKAEKETGFVRLRASQKSDGPSLCQNSDNVDFATVLADLGAGGEVLIVGANYDRLGFAELHKKSDGNRGQSIEVIGKLREMPPSSRPSEKWKVYCGAEKLAAPPPGGRWVLEMREP